MSEVEVTGHLSKDRTGHVQSQRLDGHPFLKGVSSPVKRLAGASFKADYRKRIETAVAGFFTRSRTQATTAASAVPSGNRRRILRRRSAR